MHVVCMSSEPVRPRLRAIQGGESGNPAGALTDAELLAGIASGDQRVAGQLYRQLLPAVEGSLIRVLGRRDPEHEDLVQVAFEQIILTLSRHRYAGACSLKTWASSIAGHVALKSIRTRTRRRRWFGGFVEPEFVEQRRSQAPDAEQQLTDRRTLDQLKQELAGLSPSKAEALLLHDVLGHGLGEIAAMTGVSVAAAQSRVSRGRRELMARFDSDKPGRSR